MSDFEYEIKETIATLSEGRSTTKKVCLISYNKKASVIDIRNWSNDGEMRKGITLTMSEADILTSSLVDWLARFK